ncbi:MAG: hypothetical protein KatS3mg077_2321 [Candidatus Binatia bacterium]|nr:MAG: hypothetical protein KatS3mg077_2321 [Candidatus Binatia bacterium]
MGRTALRKGGRAETRATNLPKTTKASHGHDGTRLAVQFADVSWVVLLLALLGAAYAATLSANFVRWDDQFYVSENPLVQSPEGWKAFWNPTDRRSPQFYPLVFSSYWIEYRLWGLDARGYHLVNLLLHGASSVIAYCLVRWWGFEAPLAFLASSIFALHPVQVASVAWISERKNTLSGFFLLLAFASYWKWYRERSTAWYAVSFCCFAACLLSKTQPVLMPVSFLLAQWAAERSRRECAVQPWWERGMGALPFLAASLVMAAITARFEHDRWPPLPIPWPERLIIAANALGFYITAVLWPAGLSPIYAKWDIQIHAWQWWVAPLGWACAAILGWRWRDRLHPWVVWGLGHFVFGIFPVLGFVPFNFFTYSYVADHFSYFSMIGAGVVAAVLLQSLPVRTRFPRTAVPIALALLCAALSFRQALHWRDNLSFWLAVREHDPEGFLPNFNLGLHFRREERWDEALRYFRAAAEARPYAGFVFRRYAEALLHARGASAVLDMCSQWLRKRPGFAPAYLERGRAWEQTGNWSEAARDYEEAARYAHNDTATAEEARVRLREIRRRLGQTRP